MGCRCSWIQNTCMDWVDPKILYLTQIQSELNRKQRMSTDARAAATAAMAAPLFPLPEK